MPHTHGRPSALVPTAGLYLRTVATLRPAQMAARLRLRTQRMTFRYAPALASTVLPRSPVPGCWPAGFVPFDGRVAAAVAGPAPTEIAHGHLRLLGHSRELRPGGGDLCWNHDDAPLLWRYHLHYWDWAWALAWSADGGELFADLYCSWRNATRLGQGIAWAPYVASLRAWTLCGLWHPLIRGTRVQDAVQVDLGMHRAFLRRHLETDVGGNHLTKNYKAIIGLAVAAGDTVDRDHWVEALLGELRGQVLADGGHFERAPAYHCQVLADLTDLAGLLASDGAAVPDELTDKIHAMRRWLSAVLAPDGAVPLLNDGFPVPAAAVQELLTDPPGVAVPTVTAPAPQPEATRLRAGQVSPSCVLLADSGLAVLRRGRWHVLADVGLPCPDELPAHSHADTLAFLLWHDGVPLLVDTGTSTYEPGPTRDAERGTAAHSTVVVDGADSTEVWGAFRAGRRARPRLVTATEQAGVIELTASHDGYRHLPGRPVHRRTWRVAESGVVLVDRITGTGWHRVELVLAFAPGTDVTVLPTRPPGACLGAAGTASAAPTAEKLLITTPGQPRLVVRVDGPGCWQVRPGWRATGWDETTPAPTAIRTFEGFLPLQLSTEIRLAPSTDQVHSV
nr:heparinase II/III family protein [Parafrankia elaeagni]